jgi:uncharacterized protein with von Willebrand factor type A (vWA) domain
MALQVYNINIKVSAESQAEADALQTEFLAFVRDKREQGIPVKASRVIDALQRFKHNIFVHNFLNQ